MCIGSVIHAGPTGSPTAVPGGDVPTKENPTNALLAGILGSSFLSFIVLFPSLSCGFSVCPFVCRWNDCCDGDRNRVRCLHVSSEQQAEA